jgi:DNA replication and repair protein RecF
VQYGHQQYKLEGVYDGLKRTVRYDIGKTPPKRIQVDGTDRQRLSYHQKVPVVLFEPDELRILSGSPQRRRDYLDGLISRLWPEAGRWRSRYERALRQRNAILKQAYEQSSSAVDDEFFVWDIKLAQYASLLVEQRQKLIAGWNNALSDVYSRIAGKMTAVLVTYKTDTDMTTYNASLLRQLHTGRRRDIARGFTGVGPHRDDFTVLLNGAEAATSASRGEVRTLVLALKIIELSLLDSLGARAPLLLLDDVFSELDADRRVALAGLAQDHQTIITTTEADSVAHYFAANYRLIRTADS